MLTIIAPCYNERWRLPPTLREIQIFHELHPGWISEIIIVDDGSRDGTMECAMRFSLKLPIVVVRLEANAGKWSAIRAGLKEVKTDGVLLLDADGSASITELELFDLDKVVKEKTAVFGSRFMKGSVVEEKSRMRKVVSQVYRWYVRGVYWCAGGREEIDDMQAPFKLFWLSKAGLVQDFVARRFAGDVELALRYKGKIVNHPLYFIHKRGSKVQPGVVWGMVVETLKVAWRARKW